MRKIVHILSCLCLAFFSNVHATTIRPFKDLGVMAKTTTLVILGEVVENLQVEEGDVTHFRSKVNLIEVIKGKLAPGSNLEVQNLHKRIGDLERIVWGDLDLQVGEKYVLFLEKSPNGYWTPKILSYGCLELMMNYGREYLVPMDLGAEVHVLPESGVAPEQLGVYEKDNFIAHLTAVVEGLEEWNASEVISSYQISDFRKVPSRDVENPGHCTHLSSTPLARWENLDVNPLSVYYAAAGDPGCAESVANHIQNSIQAMNSQYGGISLSLEGTHDFVPACNGQGATDGEFTSWVSNNVGERSLLVQFDDPCGEIGNLNNCSGTLAVGGLYWFGSTYEWSGNTWRDAAYGYVIVNNGVGTCLCQNGDNYEIMLTHEMTHALNVGHIAPSAGTANMNPSCCNDIQTLDIQCLDYMYQESVLPIELQRFDGFSLSEGINVQWETSAEWENNYFVLERSLDGITFEEIAYIQSLGSGNGVQNYSFLDMQAMEGTNYYRLKQIDLDGAESYVGEILPIDFFHTSAFGVQPSIITTNAINLQLHLSSDVLLSDLFITNAAGQMVHRVSRFEQTNLSQQIELPYLQSGIYFLHGRSGKKYYVARFVKI